MRIVIDGRSAHKTRIYGADGADITAQLHVTRIEIVVDPNARTAEHLRGGPKGGLVHCTLTCRAQIEYDGEVELEPAPRPRVTPPAPPPPPPPEFTKPIPILPWRRALRRLLPSRKG
jgi:hypothetical protein